MMLIVCNSDWWIVLTVMLYLIFGYLP
jgi:hypothetical protein